MTTKAQLADQLDSLLELNALIEPGETVFTLLRHVAKSGMYRAIDVYVMRDNQPRRITWTVAQALGLKYDRKHESIGIGGAGMDMGFAIVYDISTTLYRSDDGGYSHDGAYALEHRWL